MTETDQGNDPNDQSYYWTQEWQENEAVAVEELRRGESHVSHDGGAAVEWLLSEDDWTPDD